MQMVLSASSAVSTPRSSYQPGDRADVSLQLAELMAVLSSGPFKLHAFVQERPKVSVPIDKPPVNLDSSSSYI